MSSSESWIDEQLRDIPLPDGMFQRLRSAAGSDEEIDRLLKDVPLPHGLACRVQESVAEFRLDEAIRDVPVSPGLADQVRSAVAEERLDETLRDVEIPHGLTNRLGKIARGKTARSSVWALRAMAAAALLICGLYGGWLSGPLIRAARFKASASHGVAVREASPSRQSPKAEFDTLNIASSPERSLENNDDSPPWSTVALETFEPTELSGPVRQALAAGAGGSRLNDDILLMRWQILGAALRPESAPLALEAAWPLTPKGAVWPRVPGYDRLFTWRFGAHPLVWPSQRAELMESVAPLTSDTASFDLVEGLLQRRRLPDADQVRTEDFLSAAAEKPSPPPAGQMKLNVATGPSPFAQPLGAELAWLENHGVTLRPPALPIAASGSSPALLYAEAHAGMPRRRALEATHLTIALDASSGMGQSGAVQRARLAITHLLRQLEPRDRVSLVVFNDRLASVVEDASYASPDAALDALSLIRTEGGVDLGLGLAQALSIALGMPVEEKTARRVALITDGQSALSPGTAAQMGELLRQMAQLGAPLNVIAAANPTTVDPVWKELAAAAEGAVLDGRSVEQMRLALVQTLTGDSALAAAEASVRVAFNPRNVAAYRLSGYEPTALGSVNSSPIELDLQGGQLAPALWELWLLPEEVRVEEESSASRSAARSAAVKDDRVATIDLEWREPDTGKRQKLRKVIRRGDITLSWRDAPAPLQTAALAAGVAEGLKDSVYWPVRGRNLERILAAVGEAKSDAISHEGAQRLLNLTRRAEDVRRGRRDGM